MNLHSMTITNIFFQTNNAWVDMNLGSKTVEFTFAPQPQNTVGISLKATIDKECLQSGLIKE